MEVLLPLGILASTVWAIILVRWGSVLWAAVAVLFTGTFFGPDFYHYDGPFQVSSERILWFLLLGFFCIHWRMGRTDWKSLGRLDWLLIVFTIATGISTRMGIPVTDGSNPLARWLFFIAMPAGLYFAVKNSTITTSDTRLLSNFLIAIGLFVAVTAVFETRGLHGLVFPRYIVDAKHWEFFGRGRGALLNPVGIGILMTGALGCATMRWYNGDRLARISYSIVVLILLLGCYSTYTRCVWIGAFIAVSVVVFLHASKLFRLWALSTGIIAVLGLGGIAIQTALEFKRDKDLSAEAAKSSVELRPLLAIVAFEMFQDRPWTGHGFGHYLESHKKYVERRDWKVPLQNARHYHQHNIFLAFLADCGAVVTSVYVLMLVGWTAVTLKLYRKFEGHLEIRTLAIGTLSMLIGFFANGMFQDVTIIPMMNMYMWFFAAVCIGIHQRGFALQPDWNTQEITEFVGQPIKASSANKLPFPSSLSPPREASIAGRG